MSELILYCNYETDPFGIDSKQPIFSWVIKSDKMAVSQVSYQIVVAEEQSAMWENPLWTDTKETDVEKAVYSGKQLQSEKKYYWKVFVKLNNGEMIESRTAFFETALLNKNDWKASWIGLQENQRIPDIPISSKNKAVIPVEDIPMWPGYRIRKEFYCRKKVCSARAYVTAHGIYKFYIDGKSIGNYELTPEHTYYPNQLFYQVYDISSNLGFGGHTIAFVLADGWYAGRVGFGGEDCQYGNITGILMQIHITYEDGTKDIICSDESFLYEQSAYRYADLFIGEYFDESAYKKEFYFSGYVSKELKNMVLLSETMENLRAQQGMHIEKVETLQPISVWKEGKGIVVDFGSTIAGKVKIIFQGRPKREIRLLHSETIDDKGYFFQNIQEPYKNQEDRYYCVSNEKVEYEPMFTYHGFRYVKIIGLENQSELIQIEAVVITSRMRRTGQFSCSDNRINKLQENIFRSQISNMISIPTDCPQREKAGWTGDVQIFAPTACFNQDVRNFFQRWLADMRAVQYEDGQIPIIVPYLDGFKRMMRIDSSAGWGDVAVILPWVLYQYYGEEEILTENYEMMERWISYVRNTAAQKNPDKLDISVEEQTQYYQYIWNTGFHFGDWLTPSVSIDFETGRVNMIQSAYHTMHIVPTLFYYYSVTLLGKISEILQKIEQQKEYEDLALKIKQAFRHVYLDKTGSIKSELQGIYVLAIEFGILNSEEEQNAIKSLKRLIQNNNGKLDTGFLSVPYILDVLAKHGEKELAYQLLLNEECPSWLYEVKMGATSLWESWQAVLPNGVCSNLSMNHYAFGCVGDWLYRHVLGIQCMKPGYKKICFSPDFCSPFSWAKGEFDSVHGKIECDWKKDGENIIMRLTIPVNTSAEVKLQGLDQNNVQIFDGNKKRIHYKKLETKVLLLSGIYIIHGKLEKDQLS